MIELEIRVERLREAKQGILYHYLLILGGIITEKKLRLFLTQGMYTVFGMREELIASAAIILYGEKLASIGMVIVHPDYKERDWKDNNGSVR